MATLRFQVLIQLELRTDLPDRMKMSESATYWVHPLPFIVTLAGAMDGRRRNSCRHATPVAIKQITEVLDVEHEINP